MITFNNHMEIISNKNSNEDLFSFIATQEPSRRIELTRDMAKTYPLVAMKDSEMSIYQDFNVITDVMDLVLGQFIMLEQIITGKTKFKTEAENDLAIAKLIIRPKHHKEFDNSNEQDERDNELGILAYDVREVYTVIMNFLNHREDVLFRQFSGVFYESPTEDEDNEEETDNVDATGEALFNQQWYWYSMVRKLAHEDVTKYEQIYMLKMSIVMPEMSYLAQKSKIDSANQRKQEILSKL